MILGLDISTSCTGWCLLDSHGILVDMGSVELSKVDSIYDKTEKVKQSFLELTKAHRIDRVFVEQNLQAYRPGFSSAKTILALAKFNGIISYVANQTFGCKPMDINVNVARKAVGLKIKKGKASKKTTKEQVFDWVSNELKFDWPQKTLKSGPRKGLTILDPSAFDMSDAYVIAQAGCKMNNRS